MHVENREKLYKALETDLRVLHPDLESVTWLDEACMVRTFEGENKPAVDTPHLDFYPDQDIHKAYCGHDFAEYDMVLGIWKPISMNTPVTILV